MLGQRADRTNLGRLTLSGADLARSTPSFSILPDQAGGDQQGAGSHGFCGFPLTGAPRARSSGASGVVSQNNHRRNFALVDDDREWIYGIALFDCTGDHVSHRAPQADVQPAEPTAGDLPQPELSPRARAALVALVRLLARQAAEEDVRSQR